MRKLPFRMQTMLECYSLYWLFPRVLPIQLTLCWGTLLALCGRQCCILHQMCSQLQLCCRNMCLWYNMQWWFFVHFMFFGLLSFSESYCSRASAGYYLTANPDGTYNGGTQQCKSPCATCVSDPNFCLSCIDGYTIDGSSCFSDKQIAYQMIFNYPTIFNSDDSYQVAYGKILLKYL